MELFFSKLCTYPHQMSLLTTWTLASGWLRTPRHLEYLIAVSLMMYDISWEVRWKVFIFETCSVGRENLKMAKSYYKYLSKEIICTDFRILFICIHIWYFMIGKHFVGVWTLYENLSCTSAKFDHLYMTNNPEELSRVQWNFVWHRFGYFWKFNFNSWEHVHCPVWDVNMAVWA